MTTGRMLAGEIIALIGGIVAMGGIWLTVRFLDQRLGNYSGSNIILVVWMLMIGFVIGSIIGQLSKRDKAPTP